MKIENKVNTTILSINTAFYDTSVGLFHNNCFFENTKMSDYNHEKNILQLIKDILKKKNIKINDLNIISFVNGPGNFTGLRIGANVAQGLSIPYNIPIVGISTFDILADQIWEKYKIKKISIYIYINDKNLYCADSDRIYNKRYYIKNLKLSSIKQICEENNTLKKKKYIAIFGKNFLKKNKKQYLYTIEIKKINMKNLINLTKIDKKNKNNLLNDNIQLNYLNNLK
ncbi:tRNA (adenosine(37)-N6)-threonylcarbamoyltransferase complex dimerization subunit type 1 TsaB [Buchnera aphidicola]|uniref:tRNA (adenosine(37)-N6)-threonylcarbamoyltransferase complex dimerization subunit type 1 TsaB n=1 Tax=Buchnera aphidicola TaxID=9 RepID=UPI0031B8906C